MMEQSKMTMREFAIEFMRKESREVNANMLAYAWFMHKTGRFPPSASRHKFGTTSAAYKTMRRLVADGLVTSVSGGRYFRLNPPAGDRREK